MHLCVSLNSADLDDLQRDFALALAAGADMVELRLDLLGPEARAHFSTLEPWLKRNAAKLIITCRTTASGIGSRVADPSEWAATLQAAGGFGARFVDLDHRRLADAGPGSPEAERIVGAEQTSLLLSEHHLDGRPHRLHNRFLELGHSREADAVKLVWRARSAADNFEAFDLLRSARKPCSVFCMGDDGLPSRVLGRKFGNLITYCALRRGEETAPGQQTIDDMLNLYRWRSIDADTRVYGLIGDPVSHSLSPRVYNAAFAACGMNAVYVPFRVERDGYAFADFIRAVCDRPWLDIGGFSVTSPHKQNAFVLVEEEVDPVCRRIGAVNTLRFGDGQISGTNTDYQAALNWIMRGMGCDLPAMAGRRIDVLGAGGLARAVVSALRLAQAEVTVRNRTPDAARMLADEFGCSVAPLDDAEPLAGEALINCTTIGMWPEVEQSPIGPAQIRPDSFVFDAIYNPRDSKMLRDARERGCQTLGGLDLFIEQAVMQFIVLTGRTAPREVMLEAALTGLEPSASEARTGHEH